MIERLEQTTQAVLAADGAQLRAAIESVRWERRGLLQRLVPIRDDAVRGTTADRGR
jgi:hypothetical protein